MAESRFSKPFTQIENPGCENPGHENTKSFFLAPVRDGSKIAQHLSAGVKKTMTTKSRQGRQTAVSSFVPKRDSKE